MSAIIEKPKQQGAMRSENDSVLSSSGSVAHSQRLKRPGRKQLKVVECGRFGLESRDGFDEAGDGEGVADAAGAADQTEHTAFAGELDGDAHERGDPGAVNLRDAVQDSDNFLRATFDHGLESVVELFGGLADGEPATDIEYRHPAGLADVDFHGRPVSHDSGSIALRWLFAMPHGIIRRRVCCTKGTVPD